MASHKQMDFGADLKNVNFTSSDNVTHTGNTEIEKVTVDVQPSKPIKGVDLTGLHVDASVTSVNGKPTTVDANASLNGNSTSVHIDGVCTKKPTGTITTTSDGQTTTAAIDPKASHALRKAFAPGCA